MAASMEDDGLEPSDDYYTLLNVSKQVGTFFNLYLHNEMIYCCSEIYFLHL